MEKYKSRTIYCDQFEQRVTVCRMKRKIHLTPSTYQRRINVLHLNNYYKSHFMYLIQDPRTCHYDLNTSIQSASSLVESTYTLRSLPTNIVHYLQCLVLPKSQFFVKSARECKRATISLNVINFIYLRSPIVPFLPFFFFCSCCTSIKSHAKIHIGIFVYTSKTENLGFFFFRSFEE